MKFCTEGIWSNSFIVFEFRENRCSEKHTLRRT